MATFHDSIAIENPDTGEIFTRKITDITYWDGLFIFSWDSSDKSYEEIFNRCKH